MRMLGFGRMPVVKFLGFPIANVGYFSPIQVLLFEALSWGFRVYGLRVVGFRVQGVEC